MTVVAIAVALTVLASITGYAFYLSRKLANQANEQATLDNTRIVKAEALEDKKIIESQKDNEQHVKETDASNLLLELSKRLHSRPSE